MSDVGHLGPVRLFAASRDIDSHNIESREKGPVTGRLISQSIAIVSGKVDATLHYGPEFPVLEIYADTGEAG